MLPFPPGAILRDVLNVFFVALVLVRFVIDRKKNLFPVGFYYFFMVGGNTMGNSVNYILTG